MRIIAYTYCADVHCPECTKRDAAVGIIKREPPLRMGTDMHGITEDLVDSEGNRVHPVLDIDEHDFTHCGDCREELT